MSNLIYQGKRVNFAGKPIKTSSLHTDLVGYWKLDEVDGSVYDSYGNLHGSIRNSGTGVIQNQTGKINNAYQFNRDSSGAVYLPMGQFYAYQSDFTFTAWVYWYLDPDISVSIDLGIIGGETGSGSFVINKGTTYNYLRLESVALDSTGPGAGFCPSASEWAFVAVTCKYIDETHTQQVFYVNDTSVGTSKTWGYPFVAGRSSYTIGVKRPGQNQHFFNGYIDEVGIWQRVLSNDEILELYNSSAGKTFPFMKYRQNLLTNIAAYWKLDETTGTTAYDSVNNYDLDKEGSTYIITSGKINNTNAFSKINDIIDSSYGATLCGNTSAWSISFWAYLNSLPSVAAHKNILFYTQPGYRLLEIDNTGFYQDKILALSYDDLDTYQQVASDIISPNKWYHIAVVAENGQKLKLYVNNILYESTGNLTSNLKAGTANGHFQFGGGSSNYLEGKIDEVGVWNRALSPVEIAQLYNSNQGLTYPFIHRPHVVFDDFNSYNDGDYLDILSEWQNIRSSTPNCLQIIKAEDNGQVKYVGSGSSSYYYARRGSFSSDQFSQFTITEVNDNLPGLIVRGTPAGTNNTCYFWRNDALSYSTLRRRVNGLEEILAYGKPFSANDTIKLEIQDITLYCYINGVLDTSINGTGMYSDSSTILSGSPGICGYDSRTSITTIDNWYGGEIYASNRNLFNVEHLFNGNFSLDSAGWDVGAYWNVENGFASFTDGIQSSTISQFKENMILPLQENIEYKVAFDISAGESDYAQLRFIEPVSSSDYLGYYNYGPGHHEAVFTAYSGCHDGGFSIRASTSSSSSFSISNISLKTNGNII